MAYVYWIHEKSGEIYAVQTDEADEETGITGPIAQSEATVENYGNFDYDTEDVEWSKTQPWRPYEPKPD